MSILTSLVLFLICVILAACKGDFSGFELIGKGIGYIALLIAAMWLFTHPVLLVIVIAILLLVAFVCNKK